MEDKRKRTVNYTNDEISVLTELLMKYRDLVENKRTDATTNAEKVKGWILLANEFNSISTHCSRTPESLKTCWENIKRQSKKQSASRKREIFKTGGGRQSPPSNSGADRIVESILGPALEGLENIYDSDAILDVKGKDNATSNTGNCTEIGLDTNIDHDHEFFHAVVVESEPQCSLTLSKDGTNLNNRKHDIEHLPGSTNTSRPQTQDIEDNDNNFKWEGWTPNSLKRPISEVLKSNKENHSWLKRRRPNKQNLSDQFIEEKINLVKTLILNAQEE